MGARKKGVHLYYKGALIMHARISSERDSLLARMEFDVRSDAILPEKPSAMTCVARIPVGASLHDEVFEIDRWNGALASRLPHKELSEFAEACIREQIGREGTHLRIFPETKNLTIKDSYFEGNGRSAFIPFDDSDADGW